MLIILVAGIKIWKCWLDSSGMMFIPCYMKIHHLVPYTLWEAQRDGRAYGHDTISLHFLILQGSRLRTNRLTSFAYEIWKDLHKYCTVKCTNGIFSSVSTQRPYFNATWRHQFQ
jgi:hypothetical protein